MTSTDQNPSHAGATEVLPDPGDTSNAGVSAERADDLIAKLADAQIDQLIGEEGLAADDHHDCDQQSDAVIDEAINAIDVTDAPVAFSPANDHREHDLVAPPADEPDVETIETAHPPSFDPPKHADLNATDAAHAPGAQESSDADAVARELALDVAMLSKPLPAVVEHDAVRAAPEFAAWRRAMRMIGIVPTALLAAINLPVQALSDRGREVIGAVGLVTLVNAAGLLIYLTVFAHRH